MTITLILLLRGVRTMQGPKLPQARTTATFIREDAIVFFREQSLFGFECLSTSCVSARVGSKRVCYALMIIHYSHFTADLPPCY